MMVAKRMSTKQRQLIERICHAESDLSQIAGELKVNLVRLADLADAHDVMQPLRVLGQLTNLRNEHFLHRYRLHAMARLVELASQSEDAELARKAAVDLLKVNISDLFDPADSNQLAQEHQPIDPQAVLGALEKIGQEAGDGQGTDAACRVG
jgi:hypothetical protein